MMLIICFDLPRYSKAERRQASKFRKRLIELGFSMMQFSIYERYVANYASINNILANLDEAIPDTGKIIGYQLTDEQYHQRNIILGSEINYKPKSTPKLIYL